MKKYNKIERVPTSTTSQFNPLHDRRIQIRNLLPFGEIPHCCLGQRGTTQARRNQLQFATRVDRLYISEPPGCVHAREPD
jgi:hypothetical protein